MNKTINTALLAAAGAATLALTPSIARAGGGAITVSGATNITPNISGFTNHLTNLTYTQGSFTTTTNGGQANLGTGATADLGTFTLTRAGFLNPQLWLGQPFELDVTFSQPVVIQGSKVATQTASIYGVTTYLAGGGALIDFDNTPTHFTYARPGSAGSFDFSVNDLTLAVGGKVFNKGAASDTEFLTGQISNASEVTPEPGTWAAFAFTGLGAAGLMLRARKSRGSMSA